MFKMIGENRLYTLDLFKRPTDLVSRGRKIIMLSAPAKLLSLDSRFFFVRRINEDYAFLPQRLGFRFIRNVALQQQASCEPHDQSPLSFLKALVVQKFPGCLSSSVTASCRIKNYFESGVKPLRRKYAINLCNAFFSQNFTGSFFQASSSHGGFLAVSKTPATSVCPLEFTKAAYRRIGEAQTGPS